MNRLIVYLAFFFYASISFALQSQSNKKETQLILGIADFTASTNQQKRFTGILKEHVTDVLNQTNMMLR